MEISLLAGAAGVDYYLGQFEFAAVQLDDAERVAWRVSPTSVEIASIYWIRSHLYRSKGNLDQALHFAMRAADIYIAHGNAASAARIQWLVAEVALDRAASFAENISSAAATAYLKLASPYIKGAQASARAADDPIGRAMAVLAAARRDWLMHANKNVREQLDVSSASQTIATILRYALRHISRWGVSARCAMTMLRRGVCTLARSIR